MRLGTTGPWMIKKNKIVYIISQYEKANDVNDLHPGILHPGNNTTNLCRSD